MAGHADEDTYSNVDLVCALCDNGGEIARCVPILPCFLSTLNLNFASNICGYEKHSECSNP